MGGKYSRFVPKYFTNFNIENRAHRYMDLMKKPNEARTAPRHPSTEQKFQHIQVDSKPDIDEQKLNRGVAEHANRLSLKRNDQGTTPTTHSVDKRPRKENEARWGAGNSADTDPEYTKYGYTNKGVGDSVAPGKLSLRMFDELIDTFDKASKATATTTPVITTSRESVVLQLAEKYKITAAEVNDLVDTYKPLRRMVKEQNVKNPLNMPTNPLSMQVFTNLTDGKQTNENEEKKKPAT